MKLSEGLGGAGKRGGGGGGSLLSQSQRAEGQEDSLARASSLETLSGKGNTTRISLRMSFSKG